MCIDFMKDLSIVHCDVHIGMSILHDPVNLMLIHSIIAN